MVLGATIERVDETGWSQALSRCRRRSAMPECGSRTCSASDTASFTVASATPNPRSSTTTWWLVSTSWSSSHPFTTRRRWPGSAQLRTPTPGWPRSLSSTLPLRRPPPAAVYALDWELTAHEHVRRYGMHGISHEYVAHEAASHLGRPLDQLRLIVLHLGRRRLGGRYPNGDAGGHIDGVGQRDLGFERPRPPISAPLGSNWTGSSTGSPKAHARSVRTRRR